MSSSFSSSSTSSSSTSSFSSSEPLRAEMSALRSSSPSSSVWALISRAQMDPCPFQLMVEADKERFMEQAEVNEGEWVMDYLMDAGEEGDEEEEEEEENGQGVGGDDVDRALPSSMSSPSPVLVLMMTLTAERVAWFAGGDSTLYGLYVYPSPSTFHGMVVRWSFLNSAELDLYALSLRAFALGEGQDQPLSEDEKARVLEWLAHSSLAKEHATEAQRRALAVSQRGGGDSAAQEWSTVEGWWHRMLTRALRSINARRMEPGEEEEEDGEGGEEAEDEQEESKPRGDGQRKGKRKKTSSGVVSHLPHLPSAPNVHPSQIPSAPPSYPPSLFVPSMHAFASAPPAPHFPPYAPLPFKLEVMPPPALTPTIGPDGQLHFLPGSAAADAQAQMEWLRKAQAAGGPLPSLPGFPPLPQPVSLSSPPAWAALYPSALPSPPVHPGTSAPLVAPALHTFARFPLHLTPMRHLVEPPTVGPDGELHYPPGTVGALARTEVEKEWMRKALAAGDPTLHIRGWTPPPPLPPELLRPVLPSRGKKGSKARQ